MRASTLPFCESFLLSPQAMASINGPPASLAEPSRVFATLRRKCANAVCVLDENRPFTVGRRLAPGSLCGEADSAADRRQTQAPSVPLLRQGEHGGGRQGLRGAGFLAWR